MSSMTLRRLAYEKLVIGFRSITTAATVFANALVAVLQGIAALVEAISQVITGVFLAIAVNPLSPDGLVVVLALPLCGWIFLSAYLGISIDGTGGLFAALAKWIKHILGI